MGKSRHHQASRGARAVLLIVCVALFAMILAGCSSAGSDQKAMRETVGKFYAAQGALDLATIRASLYDPQNKSGLATATVPPGATKTDVTWKTVGDTVVVLIPSQELTLTVSTPKTPPNAVLLSDGSGQGQTLIMRKDGSAWKIDFEATEKAASQAAGPAPGTGGSAAATPAP